MGSVNLKELLESTGITVKYRHSKEKIKLPFILYFFVESENLCADNVAYKQSGNYSVNLCTDTRDRKKEKLIENVFKDAEIYWEKYEVYIKEEEMYQVTYEINIGEE